jgi:hypothetical protein
LIALQPQEITVLPLMALSSGGEQDFASRLACKHGFAREQFFLSDFSSLQ